MNIKRAIGASLLTYVASILIGLVTMVLFGVSMAETQEIPPLLWYVGAVSSIVLASAFTFWYFRGKGLKPSMNEGLKLGGAMIATGFVMDAITLLPVLQHEEGLSQIMEYYSDPMFWVTVALVVAAAGFTGMYLEKKR